MSLKRSVSALGQVACKKCGSAIEGSVSLLETGEVSCNDCKKKGQEEDQPWSEEEPESSSEEEEDSSDETEVSQTDNSDSDEEEEETEDMEE